MSADVKFCKKLNFEIIYRYDISYYFKILVPFINSFHLTTMLLLLILFLVSLSLFQSAMYEMEDIDVPENCALSAKPGDHLLFEYVFSYANGSQFGQIIKKPAQLFHLILVSVCDVFRLLLLKLLFSFSISILCFCFINNCPNCTL